MTRQTIAACVAIGAMLFVCSTHALEINDVYEVSVASGSQTISEAITGRSSIRKTGAGAPKERALIVKVERDVTRKSFSSMATLKKTVYESLFRYLQERDVVNVRPFDESYSLGVKLDDLDADRVAAFVRMVRAAGKVTFALGISTTEILSRPRDAAESAQAPARSEFPIEAVREAIVNAVCHRDYTDDGSVQVMLFRDRLEVLNPGTLPRGWTAANLLQTHDSKPHNGIIATAMQWAGYVEKSGYGTEDIVRKCKAWGLRDPEYHPSSVDFRLVLWRQEIKGPRDFTQLGEVGEVGCPKGVESSGARGVESDARSPIKSRVCDSSNRLYPPAAMGVESRGGVVHSLRDLILLSVVQQPKSRAEIARSLGKPRIFGNLVRRITTLLDDDLIELTVPDKPNSRLQKYRITKKGRQVAKLLAQSNRAAATVKKG